MSQVDFLFLLLRSTKILSVQSNDSACRDDGCAWEIQVLGPTFGLNRSILLFFPRFFCQWPFSLFFHVFINYSPALLLYTFLLPFFRSLFFALFSFFIIMDPNPFTSSINDTLHRKHLAREANVHGYESSFDAEKSSATPLRGRWTAVNVDSSVIDQNITSSVRVWLLMSFDDPVFILQRAINSWVDIRFLHSFENFGHATRLNHIIRWFYEQPEEKPPWFDPPSRFLSRPYDETLFSTFWHIEQKKVCFHKSIVHWMAVCLNSCVETKSNTLQFTSL